MTDSTNPAPNPFDPAALRLSQSFADTVGVKKLLTTVPVRKPNRQEWVRVRSENSFRLTPAAIIEVSEDREVYLVRPDILAAVPGEFATVTLFTTMSRQGTLFLWPVKLPNNDFPKPAASFPSRTGRSSRFKKFLKSHSAIASWTVRTIRLCSGFRGSFSRDGT